ncbi:MAG: metal ABC transporter permease [Atopobiaceae bacterium]|jgi:zinc transport system permease protein
MFEFVFMQRALFCSLVLGLAVPLVGSVVVVRRLSMIGDALAHASLAGVAIGLVAGLNPLVGATIAALVAAAVVELTRRHMGQYAEMSLAIVASAGVGLAGLLAAFVPNSNTFSSFLFGSLVTVSASESLATGLIAAGVIVGCVVFYRPLLLMCMDERSARLAGVDTAHVSVVFTLAVALVVSISSRIVGSLVVSSLMVIPVAAALQVARGWKQLLVLACALGATAAVFGVVISFYVGTRPGGTIVMIALVELCVSFAAGRVMCARSFL